MANMESLEKFFKYVDEHQDEYVKLLAEAVAIPSVSGEPDRRADCVRMAEWLVAQLRRLGAEAELRPLGPQPGVEGYPDLQLPPVVVGRYGNDPAKKTVCVYGHYDVQPAYKSDGWETEPFELREDAQGRMIGRGSTDDKGPILGWLWVLDAHKKLGVELPINLVLLFEGMEESGSEGLDAFIAAEKDKFFKGVDCVCISDNYWLGRNRPCLTYGLRGMSYFTIEISGPARDLHSGLYGGAVHEPMTDLVHIMSKLVTPKGEILIPGIKEMVAPMTEDEAKTYAGIDFSIKDFQAAFGGTNNIFDDEASTLQSRWRNPSLSLHGIQGAFYGPGTKTVIPAKVIGKFSIRTVPNMEPEQVAKVVVDYCNKVFAELNSRNKMVAQCVHSGRWWVADFNNFNYAAATRAIQRVFGSKPDLTREGGSIPVTLTLQEELKTSVILLPMGASDDNAHSINEKLDRRNYVEGIKVLGTYLHEVAAGN